MIHLPYKHKSCLQFTAAFIQKKKTLINLQHPAIVRDIKQMFSKRVDI